MEEHRALHPQEVVWPAFCCAILRDAHGRYLLQRRPLTARAAPGQITCFGGKRVEAEHPDACIRRELREELGFDTDRLEFCLRLVSHREIAWFYRGPAPDPDQPLLTEPGFEAVWLTPAEVATSPLSDWHRAALEAEQTGLHSVRISEA